VSGDYYTPPHLGEPWDFADRSDPGEECLDCGRPCEGPVCDECADRLAAEEERVREQEERRAAFREAMSATGVLRMLGGREDGEP
jgi:hypothetical protein